MIRKVIPDHIRVPVGYSVSVFAKDLTTPTSLIITDQGDMLLADSGLTDGNGKVFIYKDHQFEVLASGFNPPLTGINHYNGQIYVSHRGFITTIKPDGTMTDIISGLPSWGDHHNNPVTFGLDDKMYFGQGSATNSGVVGEDNAHWVKTHPYFHDYPGESISLRAQYYETPNFLIPNEKKPARTAAYSSFNKTIGADTAIPGIIPPSGSILRSNPDGSNLELVAWGLRNPVSLKFDCLGRLFCTNQGAAPRGSRPINQCPDEFHFIMPGIWYGWPDYSAGLPVTLPRFKAKEMPAPTFLLAKHPMEPPHPFASFPHNSGAMGFDFYQEAAYVAEFGPLSLTPRGKKLSPSLGHRVSKLNMNTGELSTFAINKSNLPGTATDSGGLERPVDLIFDQSGSMYLVDFGLSTSDDPAEFIPGTGVIWKISKD